MKYIPIQHVRKSIMKCSLHAPRVRPLPNQQLSVKLANVDRLDLVYGRQVKFSLYSYVV